MVSDHHSTMLYQYLGHTKDPTVIRSKLESMAHQMGDDDFRKAAAKEMVAGTRPDRVIPDIYAPYRALVRDGIEKFLSHMPLQRLIDVVIHQILMDSRSSSASRLLELAKQFPTLHKLGQIIARNPHIDPKFKQWLIPLENGHYGTAPGELLSHINIRLKAMKGKPAIRIEPAILAEASVGAVLPFEWSQDGPPETVKGVFKVLKPEVGEKLDDELAAIEKTAAFFETHRDQYEFKDFKFLEIFNEVRETLEKEVNLAAEQAHLIEAARFFDSAEGIVIPELMPFCDDTMTAMAHIAGDKITDADLTPAQRRECSALLMTALICRPLFAAEDPVLFHGDPHAGNILVSVADDDQDVNIALLDWSLAGHLSQKVRVKIVRLIKSILLDDFDQICICLRHLAVFAGTSAAILDSRLPAVVSEMIASRDYDEASLLKKTFRLLEQLTYEGMVFPSSLMLFRKAIFTLEGVIFDLCPTFNMDTFVVKYMAGLLAREMPRRFGNVLFLQQDLPENYQSLLSNSDLQALMLQQYTATIMQNTQAAVAFFDKQNQLMRSFLQS